jgi:hypothetical protein
MDWANWRRSYRGLLPERGSGAPGWPGWMGSMWISESAWPPRWCSVATAAAARHGCRVRDDTRCGYGGARAHAVVACKVVRSTLTGRTGINPQACRSKPTRTSVSVGVAMGLSMVSRAASCARASMDMYAPTPPALRTGNPGLDTTCHAGPVGTAAIITSSKWLRHVPHSNTAQSSQGLVELRQGTRAEVEGLEKLLPV